jgi:short-subunit dehydrogenase
MFSRWNPDQKALLASAGLASFLIARQAIQRLREVDLYGQVALVTGGSRGLGLLLAREFGRQGCKLVVCARDHQELDKARQDLKERGVDVLPVPCDVANPDEVERVVGDATRHFGRIDVLVNNAGVIQVGPFQAMSLQDFEHSLNVMFWGVVHPTLAVLPQMLERRSGRIVNITSIGGKVSVPHLLPYNCAKFAAVGFSEGLRAEVAGKGISVTTVVPGLMRTGSHVNALFKGQQPREFALFAPAASLPFISMDAERAARQIVRATRQGAAEVTLGLPANLLARFQGAFPGTVTDILGLANRVLPDADGNGAATARGMELERQVRSPVFDAVTTWGRRAAERFNEFPGPAAS